MKRCFLHLGLHKTGTSAIQRSLFANKSYLKQKGIYYGQTAGFEAHHNIAVLVPKAAEDTDFHAAERRLVDGFQAINDAAQDDDIIISSEMFLERNVGLVLNAANNVFPCLEVIIYLRRQDLLIESVYNQMVKQNGVHEAVNQGEYYFIDFLARLNEIARFVPLDRLHTRVYEREKLINGDLIDDFFAIIKPSLNIGELVSPSRVNESLNLMAIEVFRHANKIGVTSLAPMADLVNTVVADLYPDRSQSMIGCYLAPKRRVALLDEVRAANADILANYCGARWSTLFSPPEEILESKRADISGADFGRIMAHVTARLYKIGSEVKG
ncbi:hypothetical protein [Maricaulis sp.]|uniref:hypothetical protein n=1 Tax=Maricaulis sp. TaxID=1486257 RepID=UPI00260AA60C|nr:hypothetical protein [Maricaulis sp.]MDF1769364.1 hypothetical protein [Maricaulis sp.]